MGMISDLKQMATYSTPEQIAEVVYEAATDVKDQLRYVAGGRCEINVRNALAAWRRGIPQSDGAAVF